MDNRPFDGYVLTFLRGKEDKKSILNWVDPKDKSGEFKRQQSQFRNFISSDPSAEFPAEKDRYHLCKSIQRHLQISITHGTDTF